VSALAETVREVEALLFAAAGPLSDADLARRLPEGADVAAAIVALQAQYEGRGDVGPFRQAARQVGVAERAGGGEEQRLDLADGLRQRVHARASRARR